MGGVDEYVDEVGQSRHPTAVFGRSRTPSRGATRVAATRLGAVAVLDKGEMFPVVAEVVPLQGLVTWGRQQVDQPGATGDGARQDPAAAAVAGLGLEPVRVAVVPAERGL